jgi:hypothetical protein
MRHRPRVIRAPAAQRVRTVASGDAFNRTNTPSFSTPNATFAAPTLNSDGSVKRYGNYSLISGTASTARHRVSGVPHFEL